MLLFCVVGSLWLWGGKCGLDAWWIGLLGGGEADRSPKGAKNRGGLDVEAAGGMAEVQNEQESVVDWMLKLREAWQKSKMSKKSWWIGR